MYELIYCSLASRDLSANDIADILNTARDYNSKNNITGCLLYHNNEFIQILEGNKKVIKDLYTKIEKDKGHTGSTLLTEGGKEERTFTNWNMAFHKVTDDDVQDMGKKLFIHNFITFSDMVQKPTFAMILFWNLTKQLLKK